MIENSTEFVFDVNYVEKYFLKDHQLLTDVLTSFKQTCKSSIESMNHSISSSNAAGLANACHRLRGSTANFVDIQSPFIKKLEQIELEAKHQGQIRVKSSEVSEIESYLENLISHLTQLIKIWSSINSN